MQTSFHYFCTFNNVSCLRSPAVSTAGLLYNSGMLKYLVHTTKGLEPIVAREMALISPSTQILDMCTKRLLIADNSDHFDIMQLRTADDVGIFIAEALADTEEEVHATAVNLVEQIDWERIKDTIKTYREVADIFSLTISKFKSSITIEQFANDLSRAIISKHGWQYEPEDHTHFDIRVTIEQKKIMLSVRIGRESLFHRDYKKENYMGALRPSIAAAMVFEATQGKGSLRILDTFCGSGTILAEAYIAGHEVYGSDTDADAISITRMVLSTLGCKDAEGRVKQQDATKTTWQVGHFDCAVSNLPWDSQISVESMATLYQKTLQEWQRILTQHGTIVVLLNNPQLFIKHAKNILGKHIAVTQYTLGHLGQTPTLLICGRE